MGKKYNADEYGRNFCFVQKIENMPDDWEERVNELCIPMAYIVHDQDYYTQRDLDDNHYLVQEGKKVGEKKDDHAHFFAYFKGKRTIGGVLKLFDFLNIKYVELVVDKNAKLAYFLHIRSKEKHTYEYEQLKVINGLRVNFADLADVGFDDVLDFVDEYNITKFSEIVRALKGKNPPLFRYVVGHYALCCAYFSDAREDG